MSEPIADANNPESGTIETPEKVDVEQPDVEIASPAETPNKLDAVFAKLEAMQKSINESRQEIPPITATNPKEQTDYKTALEEQQLQIASFEKELAELKRQRELDKQKIIDDRKANEINQLLDGVIRPDLKPMIASSLINKFGYDRSDNLWLLGKDGKLIATKVSEYINVELRKQFPSAFINEAKGTSRDDNTFKHVARSDVNTVVGDINIDDGESIMSHLNDILSGKMKISSST